MERLLYNASAAVIRTVVPPLKLGLVCGLDSLPDRDPVILVSNHCNAWDHYLLGSVVKLSSGRKLHFLAKSRFFASPWSRMWLRGMGAIPIGTSSIDLPTYRQLLALLERGDIVCVYPEGARNSGTQLLDFAPGAFRLASTAAVPVLPVALSARTTRGSFGRRYTRVDVAFGLPLRSEDRVSHRAASQALGSRAKETIARLLIDVHDISWATAAADASLSYLDRRVDTLESSSAKRAPLRSRQSKWLVALRSHINAQLKQLRTR